MAGEHAVFYMCPVCFRTSSKAEACHNKPMLHCSAGHWGDDCRKPLMASNGRLLTRAPRWWLQHRTELARIH